MTTQWYIQGQTEAGRCSAPIEVDAHCHEACALILAWRSAKVARGVYPHMTWVASNMETYEEPKRGPEPELCE